MNRHRVFYLIWAAACITLPARLGLGVEILDQQNDVNGSATADTATPFSVEVGQTFTVGLSGMLTRVELQLNRMFGTGGTAILTMYNTTAGLPDVSLGTATLNAIDIPAGGFGYQPFDLRSLNIAVDVGSVLAFGVRSSGESGFAFRSTFTNSTYAGGESQWRSLGPPPGPWQGYSPSHDNGFKTYVEIDGLAGDYNGDQSVNAADYTVWRNHLGAADENALLGNGDGLNGVDEGDFALWKMNYGMSQGASAAGAVHPLEPVPEPSGLSMLAVIGVLGALRRVRQSGDE